ncbi:MAG TPA: chromate resistance protein ChrB domain-containing protein [Polyangia bacterium]
MSDGVPPVPETKWLLLIHSIPPKPNYLRVKIGRRLQRLGAVAIKNSVYALPKHDEAREDLQWVAREIVEGEGDASIVEARFIDGLSDAQIEALFQSAREADYAALTEDAQRLHAEFVKGTTITTDLGRLRKRLDEVVAIDFFGANRREAVEALIAELEASMEPSQEPSEVEPSRKAARPEIAPGCTWVTRKGIKVDRIASAWLVRNFIDKQASFKFVPGQGYQPSPGELRFDMFEAEYTHEGDRCTFEVLVRRFDLDDAALHQVAEIIHDIDLKDGKYGRPEVAGIDRLIAGLCAANPEDEARLAQGASIFAGLYESFRGGVA